MSLGLFKTCHLQNMFTTHIYLIYMYKEALGLNNLQVLICDKTQPNQFEKKMHVLSLMVY